MSGSRSCSLFVLALTACGSAPQPSSVPLTYVDLTTGGASPTDTLPLVVALHGRGDTADRFTRAFQGMPTPAAAAAHDGRRSLGGRLIIDYLRPGTSSWLSLAGEVAHRMGLGRAAAGTWIVFLALALLAAAIVLASRLLLRELG